VYLKAWKHSSTWALRSHIRERLEEIRIKCNKVRYINKGAGRLSWIWWSMSKFLYAIIFDIVLEWISADVAENLCAKAIRKSFLTMKYTSTKLLMEYMQLNVKEVLLRLSEKIIQKSDIPLCIRKIERQKWRKE